jgi:CRP-like cAMP-binding protein
MRTNPPQNTELQALARAHLGRALGFRDCAGTTLDALVAAGRIRQLRKGELLVRHGERFNVLCLVVTGSLEASVTHGDGHRHLVHYLQPGDLAGLMSLVDGLTHVNDLSGRQACSVLVIPGAAVEQLRALDARLGRAFELQLSFRSRLLYDKLVNDLSRPIEVRLAQLLNTLAGLYGLPRDGELLLNIKISQSDLADWLGVHRQRVNGAVQLLEQAGLIRTGYSSIVVTDPSGLAAFVRV